MTVSLMDAMAFENTVSGLACLLQTMCRRRVGSSYAQIVSSTEWQAFETLLQHAPPLHSHPPSLWKLCVSGNLSFLRVLSPLFLNIETLYKALSRQCHFLVLILLLECCGLNPGLTQRMDGLSSEDCSQAYLSGVFKIVASVNLPLLWIYIIYSYKKRNETKE